MDINKTCMRCNCTVSTTIASKVTYSQISHDEQMRYTMHTRSEFYFCLFYCFLCYHLSNFLLIDLAYETTFTKIVDINTSGFKISCCQKHYAVEETVMHPAVPSQPENHWFSLQTYCMDLLIKLKPRAWNVCFGASS